MIYFFFLSFLIFKDRNKTVRHAEEIITTALRSRCAPDSMVLISCCAANRGHSIQHKTTIAFINYNRALGKLPLRAIVSPIGNCRWLSTENSQLSCSWNINKSVSVLLLRENLHKVRGEEEL